MNNTEPLLIELDRQLDTPEIRQSARNIFGNHNYQVTAKYAADPATVCIVVAKTLAYGVASSAIWDGIKKVYAQIKTFDESRKPEEISHHPLVGVIRLQGAGITYEIQHRADKPLTEYMQGVVINLLDDRQLPPDTARVSINLLDGYAKAFDKEGLMIRSFPYDSGSRGEIH